MNTLDFYAEMLKNGKVCYANTHDTVIVNDCSLRGLALELAVKDFYGLPLTISRVRANDVVFTGEDGKRHFMEVKSNSSPLEDCINRSSVISYAFGVRLEKTLAEQWGYVLPLKTFFEVGIEMGHIKTGTVQGGKYRVKYKTQTVWNNSKGEAHGKKAYKLEDAYKAVGAVSFKEWFK